MSVDGVFKRKGYIPYVSQDFYSRDTFIEKQGRNAEHINSTVNGKNSGWPNAAHIILPIASYNIDVIKEAHEGTILNYLETKFDERRSETFLYQPCIKPYGYYVRFKICRDRNGTCVIQQDGGPDVLSNLVPELEPVQSSQVTRGSVLPEREEDSVFKPSQIIYYGVPGCGKSNKIKTLLQNVPERNKIRVVFHPEYTNADFVGQILPKVDGRVTYEFSAGPFAQIIKRAYLNPDENFI